MDNQEFKRQGKQFLTLYLKNDPVYQAKLSDAIKQGHRRRKIEIAVPLKASELHPYEFPPENILPGFRV